MQSFKDFAFLLLLFLLIPLPILKKLKGKLKKNLPPSPWRLPILGNLHQLDLGKPHRSLLSLSQKHGPLMFLRLGSIPTLVVSSSAAAGEVFKQHDLAFSGRPSLFAARRISYNLSSVAFAPYGDYWRKARKVVVLVLHSGTRVRSFRSAREQEVKRLVDTIGRDPSAVVDLSRLTLSLANAVVCRAAFGKIYGKGEGWLQGLLSETQSLLAGFWVGDFIPWLGWVDGLTGLRARLEKNFVELDRVLDRVIEDHLTKRKELVVRSRTTEEEEDEEDDMVHVLLRHHAEASEGDTLHSLDHIKGMLMESFIAGTDTASAAITWTMSELMRNPRVMQKLREELQRVVGDLSGFVEEKELEELKYLKMVVKESLRLHAPVPLLLPRETTEPCVVQGYNIPARTRLIVNAAAIAVDPRDWEEPLRFWPERFEGSGGRDFKGQDFEFIPFGAGRRMCPGTNFAMVLVELAVANLVHSFQWRLPRGMWPEDLDMEETLGLTMHKKDPLLLFAKPKCSNVSRNEMTNTQFQISRNRVVDL